MRRGPIVRSFVNQAKCEVQRSAPEGGCVRDYFLKEFKFKLTRIITFTLLGLLDLLITVGAAEFRMTIFWGEETFVSLPLIQGSQLDLDARLDSGLGVVIG